MNPVRNISGPSNPTLRGGTPYGAEPGLGPKRNPASAAGPRGPLARRGQRSIISNRVKLKYVLISLILIAIGVGVSLPLFQSEAKRVKKQFHLLSEGVSKGPRENIFTMDQKIKKIGSLFDETCEINIPAHSVSGRLTRDEITGYAVRGRLHFTELYLKFYDFNIAFPQEGEAKVRLTARLTGKTTTGEAADEAHEIDCLLKKNEKKWMFSHIEVVEVLKK